MKKRILVVDDEPDMLEIVSMMLRSGGYEVTTVEDAEKAMIILRKERPDLILLDLHLPGMQGEEFCKAVKSNATTRLIPVLLFTVSSEDLFGRIKEMGANDYVLKPFGPEEILSKVKKYIK
jgi:CheY-like chemotaxis protein